MSNEIKTFIKKNRFLTAFLIGIILISLFSMGYFKAGTILSISNLYIEQTGSEDPTTKEWTGSFWVVSGLADIVESYLMFDSSVSGTTGQDYIAGQKLIPEGSLKVTIRPQTPYWTLPLTPETWQVYPETYGTYINKIVSSTIGKTTEKVPALNVNVWTFRPSAQGSWSLHTPFEVVVEKLSGTNIFSTSKTLDFVGGTGTLIFYNPNDPKEQLKVLDLGKLTTGLTQPPYSQILAFDPNSAFIWDTTIEKDTRYDTDIATGTKLNDYSYSQYWFGGGGVFLANLGRAGGTFGINRWSDNKSPAHYGTYLSQNVLSHDGDFPGTYAADDTFNFILKPVAANTFNDQSTLTPYGLSLVNYLKAGSVSCGLGTILKQPHQLVNLNTFGQGVSIDPITNELKVMSTYGSSKSYYQLRISTELVDTIIYQEPQVNADITRAVWKSNGAGGKVTIPDQDVAVYDVKNLGTVEATISLELSLSSGSPAQILPSATQQKTIAPNAVATFEFGIKNTNTGTTTFSGSTLAAVAKSSGIEKDRDTTLSADFPQRTGSETILPIKTVYATGPESAGTNIPGIIVTLSFGSTSMQAVTDSNGAASFSFAQSYSGTVTLSTTETSVYQGKVEQVIVSSGLNPTHYISLLKHGEVQADWLPLILGLGIISITVVAVVVLWSRRKRRHG